MDLQNQFQRLVGHGGRGSNHVWEPRVLAKERSQQLLIFSAAVTQEDSGLEMQKSKPEFPLRAIEDLVVKIRSQDHQATFLHRKTALTDLNETFSVVDIQYFERIVPIHSDVVIDIVDIETNFDWK